MKYDFYSLIRSVAQNYLQEKVPRKSASWTGDVWKVAVELANSEDMDFKIAGNMDKELTKLEAAPKECFRGKTRKRKMS